MNRPKGEITNQRDIDIDRFYNLYERTPNGDWLVDRTYQGVFFLIDCNWKWLQENKEKYAVTLRPIHTP